MDEEQMREAGRELTEKLQAIGAGQGLGGLAKIQRTIARRIQDAERRLADEEITANSGGGMVTAAVNGKGRIKKIEIDPIVIDPADPEMLEDLVVAAVAEAQTRAQARAKELHQSLPVVLGQR